MLTWLLTNVALSILALVFILLHASAPHRLRFFAGFLALLAWLVPWPLLAQWLPDLLPANVFSFELWRIERAVEAGSAQLTGVLPLIVVTGAVPLARDFIMLSVVELAFIGLTLVGCALVAWQLASHRLLLRRLAAQGDDGNWLWARAGLAPQCPVTVQREIAGAFSSGLLRPRIWVHGDLVCSPQLETLLHHELTHLRQHDNWYLLAITLVERLFWWNPLVQYLGRGTRELQELSCDERCQREHAEYPTQLAQLMLDCARSGKRPRVLALGANIFSNPNPNVKRIKRLLEQRSYPMLTRHIVGAAVTAAIAVFAVGFATAQPDNVQAVPGQRVQVFRLEHAPGAEDDVLFINEGVGVPPPGAPRLIRGTVGQVPPAQFMRVDGANGEELISLNFTDAPLPFVLAPLVNLVGGGGPTLAGVAQVRKLGEGEDVVRDLSTGELIESLEAAGGAATWAEERRVVRFHPRIVANPNLVLEYAGAADRIVSVYSTNLTLDETLELIATESGCNIFQDGDTIVVDYCE